MHTSRVRDAGVPKLDRLKERIGYLKMYQGIVVATDVGLIGWLLSYVGDSAKVSAGEINVLATTLAYVGVVLLTGTAVVLHLRIQNYIDQLGEL